MIVEPRTGLSMGEHAEKMVQEWGISREEQELLALLSHQNAAKAYEQGFYVDLATKFIKLLKARYFAHLKPGNLKLTAKQSWVKKAL